MMIQMNRCAIIIGTRRNQTLEQIKSMLNNNIKIKKESDEIGNIDLDYFTENSWKNLNFPEFLNKLKKYDALVLSGGFTAYTLLYASGFICIENFGSISPLISTGRIKGGILDGRVVILKGGSIGDKNIYLKIIETLAGNSKW